MVLATGDETLDRHIRGLPWVEIVGEARYKEAVPDTVRPGKGEVLLLSAYLPGSQDILEVVYAARTAGMRVLFLAGDMREEGFVADLVALGVYDILFNPIAIEEIEERLKTPAGFSDAARLLRVQRMPEGKGLLSILRRVPQQKKDILQSATPEGGEKRRDTEEMTTEVFGSTAAEETLPATCALSASSGPPKLFLPRLKLPRIKVVAHIAREPPKTTRGEVQAPTAPTLGESDSTEQLRLVRPVVAVWSPVPAGKTFVAVNLARALAARRKTGFADFAPDRAAHAWLLAPEGENSLGEALECSPLKDLPAGFKVGGFTAYLSDPVLPVPRVTVERLRRFLGSPQVDADIIVLDLPCTLPGWGRKLLEASIVVMVGDPDYAHCLAVRRALKELAGHSDVVLVANRVANPGVAGWSLEEALGTKPVVELPCAPEKVYAAIAAGKFAADMQQFKEGFGALAGRITALAAARKGDVDAGDNATDGVPADFRPAFGVRGGL